MADDSGSAGGKRLRNKVKVSNKNESDVQITAEQIVREAQERSFEVTWKQPRQHITDQVELDEFTLSKRKGFEDELRRNRTNWSVWGKYANFEEKLGEIQRARSIYERCLDLDARNIKMWIKYSNMEVKNKFINHARNLYDKMTALMPRVEQFWYKYVFMEEMLANINGCRQVYERWMEWEPHAEAWRSYINMELRYKEVDQARNIHRRFVVVHPEPENWIKWAKFEERNGKISNARLVFEESLSFYGEENMNETLIIGFARFEERCKEFERARHIYKLAIEHLSSEKAPILYQHYAEYEKKYGDRDDIDQVVVDKRRVQYEKELAESPLSYDTWFDYVRLEEQNGDIEKVRDVYERAIAGVPPDTRKESWSRYIYLWINYAVFEELEAEDIDKARAVYDAALDLIPHEHFTFAKVWLQCAMFEIRQKNLTRARKKLGMALGKCPKDRLFRGYIELELQLWEVDRCRTLYQKFLEFNPSNVTTWIKFAELESLMKEYERTRKVFDLAVDQDVLDMPEVLWKAYIDFELDVMADHERVRELYERLLERTKHVKVWISYGEFEGSVATEDGGERFRKIFERALTHQNTEEEAETASEAKAMLFERWMMLERKKGNASKVEDLEKRMPRKVKMRKQVTADDGTAAGWQEYIDYVFPDDEKKKQSIKLLEMARQWKAKQLAGDDDDDDDDDESDTDDEAEDARDGASGGDVNSGSANTASAAT